MIHCFIPIFFQPFLFSYAFNNGIILGLELSGRNFLIFFCFCISSNSHFFSIDFNLYKIFSIVRLIVFTTKRFEFSISLPKNCLLIWFFFFWGFSVFGVFAEVPFCEFIFDFLDGCHSSSCHRCIILLNFFLSYFCSSSDFSNSECDSGSFNSHLPKLVIGVQ